MALQISYVERLADVIEPVREFLSKDDDLFARPRIVVPNAGTKAWLWNELATKLGASDAPDGAAAKRDGIVANVDISYPGTILTLLQPPRSREPDPWSFDRLTFTVLDIITGPAKESLGIPFDVSREPLLAARRIAGLLDEYHVRRPRMIARWEDGLPHLSPVATEQRLKDGQWAADGLDPTDAWQFRIWWAVRQKIGAESPPSRMRLDEKTSRVPLVVAGLQSLSPQQITALRTLGAHCDVRVLLVHPSPPLRARWAAANSLVSLDVPPPRPTPELSDDLDPLVATWLHGTHETQLLLASQGYSPEHVVASSDSSPVAADASSLLSRFKQSIAFVAKPVHQPHDIADDPSVTIHRCHTLSRQAEVLHDALLHAFHDISDLQPHEVVIVSPSLRQLAPHLQAVFDREIVGRDGLKAKLPLVVADRGLHEVSDPARLLIDVMRLVGSRCSVEDFRAVTTHPLVQKHFGVNDDMIRSWDRLVERSKIHWGFDASHRFREGFPAVAVEPHTWRAGLERMLLGAVLPAAKTEADDGNPSSPAMTIPLEEVPLSSLTAIETLIRIFAIVRDLDEACHDAEHLRSAAGWCEAVEESLIGLCGSATGDLAEPLRAIRRLREAASTTPVPFHDVRTLLEESLTSVIGRQPLRTGAITATSMVPLRDVPFRVICVAGYDDKAVSAAEPQGDDLVSRQPLAGDGDPRIDTRRALLDCILAACDRVVITCTGMDIRTNKPLPLVTPLAELVDFAVRHGVRPAAGEHPSGIEIRHPRHAVGRRNFEPGAVQPGLTWSHDAAALVASRSLGCKPPKHSTVKGTVQEMPVIELSLLEDMVRDPLKIYLKKSLGIATWRDDEEFPEATFPLTIPEWEADALRKELVDRLASNPADDDACIQRWIAEVRSAGKVPFGDFGDAVIRSARQLASLFKAEAAASDPPIPLHGFESLTVNIQLPNRVLTGTIPIFHRPTGHLVDIRVSEGDRASPGMPLHLAALRLLVAQADARSDRPAIRQSIVAARHTDWEVDGDHEAMIVRTVRLADSLMSRDSAIARLAAICDLMPRALSHPCGRFRSAAAAAVRKADSAHSSFNAYVNSPGFFRSREALVYGLSPRFDDVLGPDSPELAFHKDFERLFTITNPNGTNYELSHE